MLRHKMQDEGRVHYRLSSRGVRLFKQEVIRLVALLALVAVAAVGIGSVVNAINQSMPLYTSIRSALVSTSEVPVDKVDAETRSKISAARDDVIMDSVCVYLVRCVEGESSSQSPEVLSLVDRVKSSYDDLDDVLKSADEVEGMGNVVTYALVRGVVNDAMDADPALLDNIAPEALDAVVGDPAETYVYSWPDDGNPFVLYSARGSGDIIRQDNTLYEVLGYAFRIGAVLFVLGVPALIIGGSIRRSLVRYDALFGMVSAAAAGHDLPEDLPEDVQEDRAIIETLRSRQEHREEAARAAEGRKNELVAYLAHDIKTPLTSVTGYLALLDEAPDLPSEQRQRYVSSALAKARRLDRMLDEFFDITRFNIADLEIERSRFDLATFCEQVADEFQPQAEERNVSIEVSAPEGARVAADTAKLFRAMENIVRNAIVFADAGTAIEIAASLSSEMDGDSEDGAFTISVTDCGREISGAHLDRIFEKFFREDPARSSDQGGAGLGLAIAREIVRAHGGDIAVESDNGITTFTIMIPQPKR